MNGCKVEMDSAKTMQFLHACEKVYKGTFKTTKIILMSGCERLYMGKTKTTQGQLDQKDSAKTKILQILRKNGCGKVSEDVAKTTRILLRNGSKV